MTNATALVLSLTFLFQSPSGLPVRLGPVGRLLTDEDIRQIEQIASFTAEQRGCSMVLTSGFGTRRDPGGQSVYLVPTQVTLTCAAVT
jgi:hypothetical protein